MRIAFWRMPIAWLNYFAVSRRAVVLVSNEVGSGIVPDNEMGRLYRDLLGGMNQRIAAVADEVILMVARLPMFIKQPVEARA